MAETDSQPIAENEQVKELLALLKDNNTPGYEEFARLIGHVTGSAGLTESFPERFPSKKL